MKSGHASSVRRQPGSDARYGHNAVNVTYKPMKISLQRSLDGSARIVTRGGGVTCRIRTIIIKYRMLIYYACVYFPRFYTISSRPSAYYFCLYSINYKL